MVLFCERGIRRGISQCSNRYAKSNNNYMENYDSQLESNFIVYWVINNLYRYTMMKSLPYGGF